MFFPEFHLLVITICEESLRCGFLRPWPINRPAAVRPSSASLTRTGRRSWTTWTFERCDATTGLIDIPHVSSATCNMHFVWPSRLYNFYLFHVNSNDLSSKRPRWESQGGCERNQGCKSCCRVSPHLRYSIFTSTGGSTEAIPHRSKALSYILYDALITERTIGQEFSSEGKGETNAMLSIYHGRQGQIWWSGPDWDRFKQQHQQPVCVCRDPDG